MKIQINEVRQKKLTVELFHRAQSFSFICESHSDFSTFASQRRDKNTVLCMCVFAESLNVTA